MSDQLDTLLDLVLREMELHAANLSSLRQTVGTILSLGIAVETVIASAAFDHDPPVDGAQLIVGVCLMVLFLAFGLKIMWLSKGALSWPDGAALLTETGGGSGHDVKRSLITTMRQHISAAEGRIEKLQIRLIGLMLILGGSAAWWIVILRTAKA